MFGVLVNTEECFSAWDLIAFSTDAWQNIRRKSCESVFLSCDLQEGLDVTNYLNKAQRCRFVLFSCLAHYQQDPIVDLYHCRRPKRERVGVVVVEVFHIGLDLGLNETSLVDDERVHAPEVIIRFVPSYSGSDPRLAHDTQHQLLPLRLVNGPFVEEEDEIEVVASKKNFPKVVSGINYAAKWPRDEMRLLYLLLA